MKRTSLLLSIALPCIFVACTGSQPSAEEKAAASRTAQQTADRLTGALLGELTTAMKEGGPIRAIQYCSENAQNLTNAIGKEMGVSVRRVTIKPRNPLDAPDEWEREVLERFDIAARQGLLKADIHEDAVVKMDGRLVMRSMKPILIKQPCLMCHGTGRDIPKDVEELLNARYPEDMATGYVVGDFRGAVSVIVPLDD
jgi:hypothetical protein